MNRIVVAAVAVLAACSNDPVTGEPETVFRDRTPVACVDALDKADLVIAVAAEAMDHMADGFDAAARFDVAGLEQATQRITALTPEVTAAKRAYNRAAAECRAAE